MQRTRQNNPEYMQVICEIVDCLINQLHHPLLSSPRADEIAEWFHQVKQEEVEIAMQRLREENRIR
jgi:glutaredoxin 2